jgi:hypothetical protein
LQESPVAHESFESHAAMQNVPAAGKSGCAAHDDPAPHSASSLHGWQNGVSGLHVRSAVLQYWPAPQAVFDVQPPTVSTHRPVNALQNFPEAQAASLVQTQRRIS